MRDHDLALKIINRALELGFEACGIIKIDSMKDYANKLEERMAAFPDSKPIYEALALSKLAFPQKTYDWAKSVIICVRRYGKYKIPHNIDNYFGKYYLFDYRFQKYSRECSDVLQFESYLTELGLKIGKEVNGNNAARWAAIKANLGVIRKNNFFYTKSGSWVWLETWLADAEMEYYETVDLPACPKDCTRCIDACPTGALTAPFAINPVKCIARHTYGAKGLPAEEFRDKMGKWLYGCDECQNVCPINRGKWEEIDEFPQLNEIAEQITLEKIVTMDEKTYTEVLQPKFWYINQERSWVWKCNALRVMVNDYNPKYDYYLKTARGDSNQNIREMAIWGCNRLGL
jgi:epoxyqueuosine reductase